MDKRLKMKIDTMPDSKALLELYNDVGWTAYTKNPDELCKAVSQSLKVWTVSDGDRLVALARVVGDGVSIIFIQDILVLTAYQGQGIGSHLLQRILNEYQSVRQILLLTGNEEKTVSFYRGNGLVDVAEFDCIAFMK